MPAVNEIVRLSFANQKLPTGLESYPHATLAWKAWMALLKRLETRAHSGEFTAAPLEGRDGWEWSGSLPVVLRGIEGEGVATAHVVNQVRKFLSETGNMMVMRRGSRPLYWIAREWVDASPATLARMAATDRRGAEEQAERSLRVAPPEPQPGDQPGEDYGVITPDQFSVACRWCPEIARLQESGALTRLRVHEREKHPEEYWKDATHVCVIHECEWAAAGAGAYNTHLELVHRMPGPARVAVTAQAVTKARTLRIAAAPDAEPGPAAAKPAPEPAEAPAGPAPAEVKVTAEPPRLAVAAEPPPLAEPQQAAAGEDAEPGEARDEVPTAAAARALAVLARYFDQAAGNTATVTELRAEVEQLTTRAETAEGRLRAASEAALFLASAAAGEQDFPVAAGL